MNPIDVAALAVLGAALLRGLLKGAIREAFALVALAAACVVARLYTAPLAAWLDAESSLALGLLGWRIAAGASIAIGVVFAVAVAGRFVRRGVRAAGLGMADRLAGGAVGAAEGAIVVALLVLLGITLAGREHSLLADSRTLAAFEVAEQLAHGELPEVAAPPRGLP